MLIGGKTRKARKPEQPQFVVQRHADENAFLLFRGGVTWIGDPNAATKFDSKYAAKTRVRELADVPQSRVFKEL